MKLSDARILSYLETADPYEFENFIAELWQKRGWKTYVRSGSGDRAVDIEAGRDGRLVYIQAKRYSPDQKVNSGHIRKYATLYIQNPTVDSVVLVTTSTYTEPARDLAVRLNVTAVDGQELCGLIRDYEAYDLLEKYTTFVQPRSSTEQTRQKPRSHAHNVGTARDHQKSSSHPGKRTVELIIVNSRGKFIDGASIKLESKNKTIHLTSTHNRPLRIAYPADEVALTAVVSHADYRSAQGTLDIRKGQKQRITLVPL
jgi:hypothetical protein